MFFSHPLAPSLTLCYTKSMADESESESESVESGENTLLREAVDALRQGDRLRARDLLTRLLKTDQNNPTYWTWLSAAVDSPKERLYCLQNALRLDPQSVAAKRGLVMLGALPPDDSVTPFPVNHPRSWEDKLVIPKEPRQVKRGWANPVTRVFIILGIAVAVVAVFVGGYMLLPKGARPVLIRDTPTKRPPPTVTLTPSSTPLVRTNTPTFLGPTPLSYFLEKTYTATPVYAVTEHPPMTSATFKSGLRSMAMGNYNNARVQFQEVLRSEPDAPDVYYFIGESYRLENNPRTARDQYQEAINHDPTFAPAFLGRARANLEMNPDADVIADLNEAVRLDPNYVEALTERGKYLLKSDPSAAIADLKKAVDLNPDSALAYLYLAQAQLENNESKSALDSALRANQLDMTLVPVYLALARAYIGTGQADKAVGVLQTYTVFVPNDTSAFLSLGTAYNAAGLYEPAINILDKLLAADRRNGEGYFQRGWAYLNLEKPSKAEDDFKLAISYDPIDFDSQLGLARAYDMEGKAGDAYIQAEVKALPLAKSDYTKAQVYYWQSIFLNEMKDEVGERASWYRLIALPPDVMPAEWRTQAFKALGITPTPTKTPYRSPTPTRTKKP
jgi:tetratricopeptide (TPR) repeat protein